MSGFNFLWDTRKGLLTFKWDGLFSLGREGGRKGLKILGFSIPFHPKINKVRFPVRWFYIKNGLLFLTRWRLEKIEGTISFPDPMINGVVYGWLSAIGRFQSEQKFNVTINFLGENSFSGQASIPPKILILHLRRWILPLFLEMVRSGRKQRGEERKRR